MDDRRRARQQRARPWACPPARSASRLRGILQKPVGRRAVKAVKKKVAFSETTIVVDVSRWINESDSEDDYEVDIEEDSEDDDVYESSDDEFVEHPVSDDESEPDDEVLAHLCF